MMNSLLYFYHLGRLNHAFILVLLIAALLSGLSLTGCREPHTKRRSTMPDQDPDIVGFPSQKSETETSSSREPAPEREKVADVFAPKSKRLPPVYNFSRCTSNESANPQSRSFAAMVIALQEGSWVIDKMDKEQNEIHATACLRNSPHACATIRFSVKESGDIVATESPSRPLPLNLADDVGRWMVILEQKYSVCRCYTDDFLRQEMVKFGFEY